MKKAICTCLVALTLVPPSALYSQSPSTIELQRFVPVRHFVCNTGYTPKECIEEMVVLRAALANYPAPDLGEWTWVLVRSEDWKIILLTHGLDPNIPAITDPAIRTTFFEEVLVAGASGRMSELMAIWHMGRESLLDSAIRHELGHALCNDPNEMNADRVARLLEQKNPISCRTKATAKRDDRPTKLSFP